MRTPHLKRKRAQGDDYAEPDEEYPDLEDIDQRLIDEELGELDDELDVVVELDHIEDVLALAPATVSGTEILSPHGNAVISPSTPVRRSHEAGSPTMTEHPHITASAFTFTPSQTSTFVRGFTSAGVSPESARTLAWPAVNGVDVLPFDETPIDGHSAHAGNSHDVEALTAPGRLPPAASTSAFGDASAFASGSASARIASIGSASRPLPVPSAGPPPPERSPFWSSVDHQSPAGLSVRPTSFDPRPPPSPVPLPHAPPPRSSAGSTSLWSSDTSQSPPIPLLRLGPGPVDPRSLGRPVARPALPPSPDRLGENSTASLGRIRTVRPPQEAQTQAVDDRVVISSFWEEARPCHGDDRLFMTLLEVKCGEHSADWFRPVALMTARPLPLVPNRGDRHVLDIRSAPATGDHLRTMAVTAHLTNLGDGIRLEAADIHLARHWLSGTLDLVLSRKVPTSALKWLAIPLRRDVSPLDFDGRFDRDLFAWREMRDPLRDHESWGHDKVFVDKHQPDQHFVARPDRIAVARAGLYEYDLVRRQRPRTVVLPWGKQRTVRGRELPEVEPPCISASVYRAFSALPEVMYTLNEVLIADEASGKLFGGLILPNLMRCAITTRDALPHSVDLTYEVLEFGGDRLIGLARAFQDLCAARRMPARQIGVESRTVVMNEYLAERARSCGISKYIRTATLSDAMDERTGTLLHMRAPVAAGIETPLEEKVHADVCEAIVAAAFLPQGGSFERSIEVMEYLGLGFKHLEAIRRIAARSMSLWGDKPPTIPVWSSLLVPPLFDDRILANALALYRVLIPWSRLERASHPRHAESPPVAVAEWKLGQSALRLFIVCHFFQHFGALSPRELNRKMEFRITKNSLAAFCITSGLARHLDLTSKMQEWQDQISQTHERRINRPQHFWKDVEGAAPPEFASFISCLFAALIDAADLDLRPAYSFFNSFVLPWQERFCI